ncbi:MAG: GNAT family N-acetyltransferase [Acidimicrobiales bacterium]
MSWQSERLRQDHVVDEFASGEEDLDHWLKEFALHASRVRTASTFVWAKDKRVVGFYALCAHHLQRAELRSTRVAKGRPGIIPATLIAKLGLDQTLQGQEYGGQLLVDALERIVIASAEVAAKLVVVDALNDRVTFYEKFGFVRTEPEGTRLVRTVSDIAKDLI